MRNRGRRRSVLKEQVSAILLQCSSVGVGLNQRTLELILQLEPKGNQSTREVFNDFVHGIITCTDVYAESVSSDKGDNCERCGGKGEHRETVLKLTVTVGRTVCPCVFPECSSNTDGTGDVPKQDMVPVGDGILDQSGSFLCGGETGYNIGVDVCRVEPIVDQMQALQTLQPFSDVTGQLVDDGRYSCGTVPIDADALASLSFQADPAKDLLKESVQIDCSQSTNINLDAAEKDVNPESLREVENLVDAETTGDDEPCPTCGFSVKCQCTFHCQICNTDYASLSELKKHLKIHQPDEGNVCDLCDSHFKLKHDLKKHLETAHANENVYTCDVCCKSFREVKALKVHNRIHSGDRPFQCDVCGKTFTNSAGLRTHSRCHTDVKKYKCDHCEKTFSLRAQLKAHAVVHSGERPFLCNLCSLCFVTNHALKRHLKTHGERTYVCQTCSKAFLTGKDLETHTTIHTGDKKFACKVCGSTFTVKSSLKNHLLLHLQVKPYKCEVCHKEYATEVQLRKHAKLHSTKKQFICEWCGKRFAIYHYLQSHLKTHIGYDKWKCDVCDKTYRDASYLKIHMKSHTGEGLLQCESCGENFADPTYLTTHKKKYCKGNTVQCEECGQEFVNGHELSLHVGVHTGERPYKCQVCGKGFVTASAMATHARRHNDSLRNFNCDICYKRFVAMSDLRKHKRCHSGHKERLDLPEDLKFDLKIVPSKKLSTDSFVNQTGHSGTSEIQPVSSIKATKSSDLSVGVLPDADTSSETLLNEHTTPSLDLADIPVIALTSDDQSEAAYLPEEPKAAYLPEEPSDLIKPESSEMLLDTASISSPIHIDNLDPSTSLENALSFVMNDSDQLMSNPYVMYKLVLPGKSPSK